MDYLTVSTFDGRLYGENTLFLANMCLIIRTPRFQEPQVVFIFNTRIY